MSIRGVTRTFALGLGLGIAACTATNGPTDSASASPFASDVAFLREHTGVVLLGDPSAAQVVVAPAYQGRVMTSTTGGDRAPSFGWIGRAAIASGTRQAHMNVFGGEDRFWLGPEGGQYSLYFKQGDPFDLDHWQVPEPIDWGAWEIASQSPAAVSFRKRMTLTNYAGTRLDVAVERTVRLLTGAEIASQLREPIGSAVRTVAYETSNAVTNAGAAAWQPQSGLPSVWILGMFNPSAATTIAIPFAAGPESTLGPVVNDAYFGKVPADRLAVKEAVVFFRGDGQYRSKIGLSPSRALDTAGSYDSAGHVLTLVQYTRPPDAREYVNSMWEVQREPYKGDVINSYNDGPPAPGKPPLGPFYELETSSPALRLAPGAQYTHVHRTFHLVGPEADLDRVARATLKIGLADITGAFR
jgi:uncharacterized protein DUF6786